MCLRGPVESAPRSGQCYITYVWTMLFSTFAHETLNRPMTLLDLLTPLCFIAPAVAGIVGGKDAGGVGVMIGIGVGLVAGGLAYYALKKTYSDEFEEKLKSQPQFVQALIEKGTGAWIVFLLVTPALVTGFSTKFIVQQMAG